MIDKKARFNRDPNGVVLNMAGNVCVVWTDVEPTVAQLSAVRNQVKGNNNSASASSATVG